MLPILFRLGPLRLPSYWACFIAGGLFCAFAWRRNAAAMGLRPGRQFWLLLNAVLYGLFLGGKLGNALFFIPFSAPDYWGQAVSMGSGYSILGALLGLLAAVWWYCRAEKLSFARVFDWICLLAPVWHAVGRLGCFLNGCCYGRPAALPWCVVFTDPDSQAAPELLGRPLHPTQLYEAAGELFLFCLLFFFVLPAVEGGRLRRGAVAAAYFAGYGLIRFFVEFYRGDTVPFAWRFTAGQALALGLLAGSAGWAAASRRGEA